MHKEKLDFVGIDSVSMSYEIKHIAKIVFNNTTNNQPLTIKQRDTIRNKLKH